MWSDSPFASINSHFHFSSVAAKMSFVLARMVSVRHFLLYFVVITK